jgi:hypothetical protein
MIPLRSAAEHRRGRGYCWRHPLARTTTVMTTRGWMSG